MLAEESRVEGKAGRECGDESSVAVVDAVGGIDVRERGVDGEMARKVRILGSSRKKYSPDFLPAGDATFPALSEGVGRARLGDGGDSVTIDIPAPFFPG